LVRQFRLHSLVAGLELYLAGVNALNVARHLGPDILPDPAVALPHDDGDELAVLPDDPDVAGIAGRSLLQDLLLKFTRLRPNPFVPLSFRKVDTLVSTPDVTAYNRIVGRTGLVVVRI
jgi:hypothetical protein